MKRLLGAVGVLAVGAVAAHRLTVRPTVAVLKVLFDLGKVKLPAGLAVPTRLDSDIVVPVPGFPDASVDIHRPDSAAGPLPLVLWIHGGAFFAGSKTSVGPYAALLAGHGYVVASLEYSLTPGALYPTPVVQANAALAALTGDAERWGIDPTRVFVGGDSAGAHISASLAAVVSNPAYASLVGIAPAVGSLAGVVLFCGFYDLTPEPIQASPFMRIMMWAYTGQRAWQSYARVAELSPAAFVTPSFPASFLTVGDGDPLDPQASSLEKTLEGQGVAVTARYFPGLGLKHEFQYDLRKPQSRSVLEDLVAFLDAASR